MPDWQKGKSYDMEAVTRREALLGQRRIDIIHWYADWDESWSYDGRLVKQAIGSGRTPMITWEAWKRPLLAIASGKYDRYIDSWARGAAALKRPIYFRIFHEFNDPLDNKGSGYPWGIGGGTSNKPGDVVRAWRHIHDVFTRAGALNVEWIWNPDGVNLNIRLLRSAYPGDGYVDFIGWDTYTYNDQRNLGIIGSIAPNKRIVLGEVGADDHSVAWLDSLSNVIKSSGHRFTAIVWFDQSFGGDEDPTLADNPEVRRSIQVMFGGHPPEPAVKPSPPVRLPQPPGPVSGLVGRSTLGTGTPTWVGGPTWRKSVGRLSVSRSAGTRPPRSRPCRPG